MAALAYIPDLQAPLAARRVALTAAQDRGVETPGQYMRNCRRSARLTRAQVAEKVGAHPGAYPFIECELAALEHDQPGNYLPLARTLKAHNAFPFNLATFVGLAAATCAPALGEWEPA
jgi:DNA-binding XRE family transcriptional regulator